MGWPKNQIRVEDHKDGRYCDYILGSPTKALIEAKREAAIFDIPPRTGSSAPIKLRNLIDSCPNAKEAVQQALSCCQNRGVPLGVVCNGPQIVIFQAIILGSPPLDGFAYVFNGFDEQLDRFSDLWKLLSPDGVRENRAYSLLGRSRVPRIPPKASSVISEPTRHRYRSPSQKNLDTLSSTLLEDIIGHEEVKPSFYRDCYVPIPANSTHLQLSKRMIKARYQRVSGDANVPTELSEGFGAYEKKSRKFLIDNKVLIEAVGARPIVVLGDVGVGKTSFFENLYYSIKDEIGSDVIFTHIDLGNVATMTSDIESVIVESTIQQIRRSSGINIFDMEFVKSVYFKDIADFEKSIWSEIKESDPATYQQRMLEMLQRNIDNKSRHLMASLGHLVKGQNKQAIIIIDNADQRDFELQQKAFLVSQEIAKSYNCLVFVALRPSTFYLSKQQGALSGYQNKVFSIAPPPADEVIEKRVTFALRVAEGQISPAALQQIRLDLDGIVTFLKVMLRSIKNNNDIRVFLSNITGGNTRRVIELVTAFCGSPNVDSQKIIDIENQKGNYRIPLHEFTKHALLGEYSYFHPGSSLVACNLYDVSDADPKEHFLAPIIISFLNMDSPVRDKDGFVKGINIIKEMSPLGFLAEQVNAAVIRLARRRLLETPFGQFREVDVDEADGIDELQFRVTSIGNYHVRDWMTSFVFFDAVSTDTPIFDDDVRATVEALADSFAIQDRYEKAIAFRGYLQNQWSLSNIPTRYLNFDGLVRAGERSFESVDAVLQKFRQKKSVRWRGGGRAD